MANKNYDEPLVLGFYQRFVKKLSTALKQPAIRRSKNNADAAAVGARSRGAVSLLLFAG